jgi:NAD(P)-dependent dehydrogenase (short-subunit alcohol dehydrogenase family)
MPLQSNTLRGGGCLHHHPAGSSTRCVSNSIMMPPPTSYERQPVAATRSTTCRHASSSSSSEIAASFEAPEPPKSHGHPVFPDIQFDNINQSSSSSSSGDDNRNSDPNAVFVISGASRGIGLQFVKSLLERTNGKIIACCRSPPTTSTTASSSNNQLYNLAKEYTTRIEILPLDIEDQTSIDTLSTYITKKYQRIDALFNVAGLLGDGGITTPGPERSISSIDRDWMMKSLGVNLIGPTMLIKALSPLMRTIGKRKMVIDDNDDTTVVIPPTNRPPTIIINLSARVGSISDNQLGGWYTYRASKSALNQITRTSSHELKRQGTHVISIHPGTTDTDLSKPFQANVQKSRLFPVEFTVEKLLDVVDCVEEVNTGGFYDWAGKALPF